MTSVEPSYLSSQLDPAFPPDKESSWPYPKESDGMVLTHNSLRGELSCLKQGLDVTVQRGTFQEWEISAIQRMWTSHFAHMDAVHHKEVDKFKPLLKQRFRIPDSPSLDYNTILCHLKALNCHLGDLRLSDAASQCQLQTIQEEFKAYETDLLSYLSEKENTILPMIRAFFTATEWNKVLRETSRNDPPPSMGSFIHFQTEERFRSVFMKEHGIPSFVWYFAFRGLYNTFQKEFLQPYEALQNGV